MPQLKLHVKKVGSKHPITKKLGSAARVQNNGTAEFDDIVKDAGKNTTMHKAELRMAFELCMDSVTDMLKQGYIVDLGPIGKIYPSCTSGWYENEDDMKLSDIKPSLYYRPGAKLVWAKGSEEDEEEETPAPSGGDTPGGDTPGGDTPGGDTPGGDTPGGGGGGDDEDGDVI